MGYVPLFKFSPAYLKAFYAYNKRYVKTPIPKTTNKPHSKEKQMKTQIVHNLHPKKQTDTTLIELEFGEVFYLPAYPKAIYIKTPNKQFNDVVKIGSVSSLCLVDLEGNALPCPRIENLNKDTIVKIHPSCVKITIDYP